MILDIENTYRVIFKETKEVPQLQSIGDLIVFLEDAYEIKIEKMNQNKLFKIFTSLKKYLEPETSTLDKLKSTFKHFIGKGYFLLDIHIIREGKELCPKQDLNFILEEKDIIKLNMNFFC